ncbi:hypothetical protein BJV77DRAFT_964986 [Russula vinacea]|nr:hypothetical protein BJV77DRAFT_964986 [Russula vinacea]
MTATDFDADLCTLATAAMQVQQHVTLHPNHQVTIYSTNPAAIQAITNLRPHVGQSFALEFSALLTQTFASSRSKIKLEWCPSEASIAGIRRCIDLARTNATAPWPPGHQEPNTIAFQKSSSKELAISAWQAHWHNADRRSQAYLALLAPPTGKLPPADPEPPPPPSCDSSRATPSSAHTPRASTRAKPPTARNAEPTLKRLRTFSRPAPDTITRGPFTSAQPPPTYPSAPSSAQKKAARL